MKVIFKFGKKLGNFKPEDETQMFSTTAAALEKSKIGVITSKVISFKEVEEGRMETKTGKLTKEDRAKLGLDSKKED